MVYCSLHLRLSIGIILFILVCINTIECTAHNSLSRREYYGSENISIYMQMGTGSVAQKIERISVFEWTTKSWSDSVSYLNLVPFLNTYGYIQSSSLYRVSKNAHSIAMLYHSGILLLCDLEFTTAISGDSRIIYYPFLSMCASHNIITNDSGSSAYSNMNDIDPYEIDGSITFIMNGTILLVSHSNGIYAYQRRPVHASSTSASKQEYQIKLVYVIDFPVDRGLYKIVSPGNDNSFLALFTEDQQGISLFRIPMLDEIMNGTLDSSPSSNNLELPIKLSHTDLICEYNRYYESPVTMGMINENHVCLLSSTDGKILDFIQMVEYQTGSLKSVHYIERHDDQDGAGYFNPDKTLSILLDLNTIDFIIEKSTSLNTTNHSNEQIIYITHELGILLWFSIDSESNILAVEHNPKDLPSNVSSVILSSLDEYSDIPEHSNLPFTVHGPISITSPHTSSSSLIYLVMVQDTVRIVFEADGYGSTTTHPLLQPQVMSSGIQMRSGGDEYMAMDSGNVIHQMLLKSSKYYNNNNESIRRSYQFVWKDKLLVQILMIQGNSRAEPKSSTNIHGCIYRWYITLLNGYRSNTSSENGSHQLASHIETVGLFETPDCQTTIIGEPLIVGASVFVRYSNASIVWYTIEPTGVYCVQWNTECIRAIYRSSYMITPIDIIGSESNLNASWLRVGSIQKDIEPENLTSIRVNSSTDSLLWYISTNSSGSGSENISSYICFARILFSVSANGSYDITQVSLARNCFIYHKHSSESSTVEDVVNVISDSGSSGLWILQKSMVQHADIIKTMEEYYIFSFISFGNITNPRCPIDGINNSTGVRYWNCALSSIVYLQLLTATNVTNSTNPRSVDKISSLDQYGRAAIQECILSSSPSSRESNKYNQSSVYQCTFYHVQLPLLLEQLSIKSRELHKTSGKKHIINSIQCPEGYNRIGKCIEYYTHDLEEFQTIRSPTIATVFNSRTLEFNPIIPQYYLSPRDPYISFNLTFDKGTVPPSIDSKGLLSEKARSWLIGITVLSVCFGGISCAIYVFGREALGLKSKRRKRGTRTVNYNNVDLISRTESLDNYDDSDSDEIHLQDMRKGKRHASDGNLFYSSPSLSQSHGAGLMKTKKRSRCSVSRIFGYDTLSVCCMHIGIRFGRWSSFFKQCLCINRFFWCCNNKRLSAYNFGITDDDDGNYDDDHAENTPGQAMVNDIQFQFIDMSSNRDEV